MKHILGLVLAVAVWAQPAIPPSSNAGTLRGKPPCSATVTVNCVVSIDSGGDQLPTSGGYIASSEASDAPSVGQIPRVNSSGGLTLPNTRLLITGTAGAAPATPPAGQFTLYLDASDKLAKIDENDTVTVIEQAASTYDPTSHTEIQFLEEFSGSHAAIGDGYIGELGWQRLVATGTTAAATYAESTDVNHPGLLQLSQGGTQAAGHGTCAYLGSSESTSTLLYGIGQAGTNNPWYVRVAWKMSSVADAAFYAGIYSGCTVGATDNPLTSAIAIRYDTGVTTSDGVTGKFRFLTCSTDTCTVTASTISADTNWHYGTISSTTSGTILFSIDGESAVSVSTNVPGATVALSPFIGGYTRTTTAKPTLFDYFKFKQVRQ